MNKVTAQEGPYITLTEAVPGALDGKEDQLLSLNNVGKAVLFDGTAPAFAVMVGKIQPGETEVRARLLGKGGTVRVIQDAAIAIGARVSGKTGTARVETAGTGARALGFKIGPAAGAQGDVAEIADVVERVGAASVDGLTALTFTAGGATGPEVAALRDAVKAILQAQALMA